MFPYFAVTGLIAVLAYTMPPRRLDRWLWVIAFLVVLLFVGLRHHVGMDWNNYLIMIERAASGSLMNAFNYAEPGYATLLWVSGQLGFGVYGSNFVGSLILTLGLFRYASTTQSPWIALLVAMPMLVVVVAMSANRQAVAIGVLLWLIAKWDTTSVVKRILGILVAALFHVSALFFLVFAMADMSFRKDVKFIMTGLLVAVLFIIFQWSGYLEYYDQLYIRGKTEMMESAGALYHVFFNAGPALLFLFLPKIQRSKLFPNDLHRNMAFLAMLLIPGALIFSTASSRISLYLFPVSISVLSAIPILFYSSKEQNFVKYLLSVFLVLVLYVWITYANNSPAYLPYKNMLFTPHSELQLCCR